MPLSKKLLVGTIAALVVALSPAVRAEDAVTSKPSAVAAPPAQPAAAAPDDARQKRFAACSADLKSLCASVEKGGGRKFNCLKDNEAKLQPGCKAVLGEIEKERAERKATKQAGKAGAAAPAAAGAK